MAGMDELAERLQAFDDAERHGRADVLESLLADDFRSIGERGFVLDKAAWIARFDDFRYVSRALSDSDVRHYGSTAIVRCIERSEAVWQGRSMALETRVSQVWVVLPGGWTLVALQFSSLPDR
jgi:hypothetical protein